MLLPLSDSPNPPGIPIVTWALIAANVAVYALITVPASAAGVDPNDPLLPEYLRTIAELLPARARLQDVVAQVSAYDLFVFRWGFRPAEGAATTLFSSMFLHGGFAHLAGNMLFLWIYGDNVEHRLGRIAFLGAYLATGIAATLFHAAFDADSNMPLVGASGAISGVLGFYFWWFPRNRVKLLIFLFPFLMDVVVVSARLVLGLYLVIDNVLPFLIQRPGAGGVAYGAHIGGFIAGLGAAVLLQRGLDARRGAVPEPADDGVGPALGTDATARPRPADATAAPREPGSIETLLADGRMTEAARRYLALAPHAARAALTEPAQLELAGWLRAEGYADAALTIYRRLLRGGSPREVGAEAHLGAALAHLDHGRSTVAYQHLMDAIDLAPHAPSATRARELAALLEAGRTPGPTRRRWI